MQKISLVVFIVSELSLLVFSYPTDLDSNIVKVKDLDTAESFWNVLGTGGRGYSGWGTGVQTQGVQPNYGYGSYGYNGGYSDGYANYGNYGNYGNYAPHGSNYYAKIPVYAGYVSQQPTYENYGIHGGHGFGKYGKY